MTFIGEDISLDSKRLYRSNLHKPRNGASFYICLEARRNILRSSCYEARLPVILVCCPSEVVT